MLTIDEKCYRDIMSVDWNNEHSKRLAEATGDPQLRVGFSNDVGCWMLAQLVDVNVVGKLGEMPTSHQEKVPWVWKHWVNDDTGEPLSIEHPMLAGYIERCNTAKDVNRRAILKALEDKSAEESSWMNLLTERSHRMLHQPRIQVVRG